MKQSEILYRAADRMQAQGYSPHLRLADGCGCFISHVHMVDFAYPDAILHRLRDVIGPCFSDEALIASGWTKRDAVAAMRIAADIAAAEGQ